MATTIKPTTTLTWSSISTGLKSVGASNKRITNVLSLLNSNESFKGSKTIASNVLQTLLTTQGPYTNKLVTTLVSKIPTNTPVIATVNNSKNTQIIK